MSFSLALTGCELLPRVLWSTLSYWGSLQRLLEPEERERRRLEERAAPAATLRRIRNNLHTICSSCIFDCHSLTLYSAIIATPCSVVYSSIDGDTNMISSLGWLVIFYVSFALDDGTTWSCIALIWSCTQTVTGAHATMVCTYAYRADLHKDRDKVDLSHANFI